MAMSGIANFAVDMLLPESDTERLIFRRFGGKALSRYAEDGTPPKSSDIQTVVLQVNPASISSNSQKIINKVPTNAPGRFVVWDWGNDLTVLTISGQTGMLLANIISSGFDPGKSIIDGIVNQLDPENAVATQVGTYKGGLADVAAFGQDILMRGLGYFELLELSPKYRAFVHLQEMYNRFDADRDILTLELGKSVYRGYFTEFTFEVTKDSPWNWNYNIGFVVMSNIVDPFQKDDEDFPTYTLLVADE